MKPALRRQVHRWIALALGAFWVCQAATGVAMVYRWELDDATLPGAAVPLDLAALDERIGLVAQDGGTVTQLYATGGVPGRYDLYVTDGTGAQQLVRIDGAGRVLRQRASGAGFIPWAASLHQSLLAGDSGKRIVGTSGLLLLATLALGLTLAWPRRGQWRRTLWPAGLRPGPARRYAWHRAAGLWLSVPAIVLVSAGTGLAFEHTVERWLGLADTPPELASVVAPQGEPVRPHAAFAAALGRFPGAELSGATFPTAERPWYRIRLRQSGEWRRTYGTTVVYVAAADARVLRVEDALDAPPARALFSNLYPIHTGEALGEAGRVLVLATACGLLATVTLGVSLWAARRRARR